MRGGERMSKELSLKARAVELVKKAMREIDKHCDEKGLIGFMVCECAECHENRGKIGVLQELFNLAEDDVFGDIFKKVSIDTKT